MIALGCRWPILAVLRTICGLCADWGRRSSRLGHCPDDGTRPHTHRSLSDYGPPEGRCASLRDGPAAHPSPGSVQPGDGAGYEEAEEWDVMTAPHGVDAIEPEKRAKPRPGGRGFVSRLTSDGHRSAALVFLLPRGLLGGLVDRLAHLWVAAQAASEGQPCPRMSRRPVTTSQTTHAARPETPANTSGEPSAMARFAAPAEMSTMPPATPSIRCHGRVNPLAWVASAAPMKVAPSAGSASAKAAAWSCQISSKAGVGSARPSAASTTAMCVHMTRADIAESVAPAAPASRDQSAPAAPRRCTSPCSPVTNSRSRGRIRASRPTATATAPRFAAW